MAIDPSEFDEFDDAASRRSPRRAPRIDRKVRLTDEEYASGDWYAGSMEAIQFGAEIDSRIQDQQVEQVDRTGVLFYTPVEFEELATHVPSVDESDQSKTGTNWHLLNWTNSRLRKVFDFFRISHGPEKPQTEYDFQSKKLAAQLLGVEPKKLTTKLLKDEEKFPAKLREEIHETVMQMPGVVTKVRKWVLTPLNMDALPQSPRRPFLMIPKWRLELLYKNQLDLKEAVVGIADKKYWDLISGEDLDKYWVEYLYTGCSVLEPDPDRKGKQITKDEALVNFIRTYDPYNPGEPPFPLRVIDGKFYIPRKYEDERGMSYRAHRLGAQEYQTAAQVYEGEQQTKERTNYYTRPHGMSRFKRKIDNPFLDLPEEARTSDEAAFAYIAEQAKLRKNSQGEPNVGWQKHECQRMARRLRKYYEDWLEEEYDRFYPSECYDYRDNFNDGVTYYGDDWESKADRIWEIMQLMIHVVSDPTVVSHDREEVNFLTFKAYIGRVENRRDIARLYNHWKMSKSLGNTKASRDLEKSDIKNARRNDHGGPYTGLGQTLLDWRFEKLFGVAGADPDARERILGPVWSRRQPWQKMPHDGTLISRFTSIWESWQKGIDLIQGLATTASLGQFPSWSKLHERGNLPEVRGYRSEYVWMQTIEYVARDPLDAWKYQDGVVIYSLLDEVNMRLDSPYKHKQSLRLRYENCINLKRFVMEMWYWQPINPKRESIEHEIEELRLYHIADLFGKVVEHTEGLPGDVIPHELKEIGYGPRKQMARMIQEMRAVAADLMLDYVFEQHNLGHAHVFSSLTSWMNHGFPYYIGDNRKTKQIVNRVGYLMFEGKVIDKLNGRGEARDRSYIDVPEDPDFEKANLMSRGINHHLWTGESAPSDGHRAASDRFDLCFQLHNFAGFPETTRVQAEKKTTKAARIARIMQVNPSSELIDSLDFNTKKSWDELDKVWAPIEALISKEFPKIKVSQIAKAKKIWLTFHDIPLMETFYLPETKESLLQKAS